MNCERCKELPGAHLFVKFGSNKEGTNFFYTSAARAIDYKETDKTFSYFKTHIAEASANKWICVVDCAGMKVKHYSSLGLINKVIKLIVSEYVNILDEIWVVHPNKWIHTTLAIVKPFINKELHKKIRIFDSDKIILYTDLEKAGLRGDPLLWLTSVFALPPEPGPLPAKSGNHS